MRAKTSIHTLVYEAAKQNDQKKVEELIHAGALIDMVLMGAHDGKHSDLCWWTLCYGLHSPNYQAGVSPLWILQQHPVASIE